MTIKKIHRGTGSFNSAMNGAIDTKTLAEKLQIPKAVAANIAGKISVVELDKVQSEPASPNLVTAIKKGIIS